MIANQALAEGAPDAPRLADRLRARTRDLHRAAERSGIVARLIAGGADRAGYALYLRNLLPAYAALEAGLERGRTTQPLSALARPEVYRASAIEADLEHLAGPGWVGRMALLPEGLAYARQVVAAASGGGGRLVAHAYVRYLGDLNGGRMLAAMVARFAGPEAAAFLTFPAIDDLPAFRSAYRAALDEAGRGIADPEAIANEAAEAFRLNIALSEAVGRAS